MQRENVVIGIGNPVMGDDRAGLEVARRIEEAVASSQVEADVASYYTVGFAIMEALRGCRRAFIVDASRLGGSPGEVREIAAAELTGAGDPVNSHAIALGQTLETARVLYPAEIPDEIRIILIEAALPETPQSPCTPAVDAAVEQVAQDIITRLQQP